MSKILQIGFLIGLALSFIGIAILNADTSVCISMGVIILGLLFLFFQTGPAASMTSAKGGRATALISSTVVNLDSKTRWRRKSLEEEELGLLLVIIGVVAVSISLAVFFLF